MTQEKKSFNEYDLLMTYLNENDDEILTSNQGCQQLDSLKQDMLNIEEILNNYEPDEKYGEQLWNRISHKLEPVAKKSWLDKLQTYLTMPQYSLVSIFAVVILIAGAYVLGNKNPIDARQQLNSKLLAQNIQLHLTQTDILLTQVNNMRKDNLTPELQKTAAKLLSSNRMFSMVLKENGQQSINQLLNNIEMMLLQLSNGNLDNNPINSHSQSLLFRVKIMNNKLNHQDISI